MSNIHVPSGVKRVVMAHVIGVVMVACCMTLHDTAWWWWWWMTQTVTSAGKHLHESCTLPTLDHSTTILGLFKHCRSVWPFLISWPRYLCSTCARPRSAAGTRLPPPSVVLCISADYNGTTLYTAHDTDHTIDMPPPNWYLLVWLNTVLWYISLFVHP